MQPEGAESRAPRLPLLPCHTNLRHIAAEHFSTRYARPPVINTAKSEPILFRLGFSRNPTDQLPRSPPLFFHVSLGRTFRKAFPFVVVFVSRLAVICSRSIDLITRETRVAVGTIFPGNFTRAARGARRNRGERSRVNARP